MLNSLEDKSNPYRAVFAVDKLNEGWDVLNLFDIVRLYNTRDGRNGVPGKTTIKEAQLIGRGARYCPFKIDAEQDKFKRKHHVSRKHPQMSRINRAAQFAPFAALTGYDDLVRESARETEAQRFLDENSIEELNDKLVFLFQQSDPPEAAFTYFVRDAKKAGGKYVTVKGKVVRYDEYEQSIMLENGEAIFSKMNSAE